jgi:hypothetical protein
MNKELIVLVADIQQEKTLDTLLSERYQSFGIRPVSAYDIFRHPRKDPGVFHEAADFLAPYVTSHHRALVMLDAAWDGAPGDAAGLRIQLLSRMQAKGWGQNDCQVIVIDPELEIWVWADSTEVPGILRTSWDDIHALARKTGYWDEGQPKPRQPKELLEALLRQQRRPRSSALFQEIARKVGLSRCQDPAFVMLRETLQAWFGYNRDSIPPT